MQQNETSCSSTNNCGFISSCIFHFFVHRLLEMLSKYNKNEFRTNVLVTVLFICSVFANNGEKIQAEDRVEMSDKKTKYIIFDTDMGGDDAWALQMILKAEKDLKNVKVLAITIVNGNTGVENAIKNTYRILDGLNRTDVKYFESSKLLYFITFCDSSYIDKDLQRSFRRNRSYRFI